MNSSSKLVILSTLLTLSVTLTAASPAEVTLFPQESSTRIDSFTSYEVTVENTGPVEDVYSLTSSDTASIDIAPRQVELEPGESEVVNIWYNPDSQKEAGRYSFDINAKSRANGNTYSAQGFVNVIREHDVSMNVQEPGSVCLGERATYQVELTNEGLQKETFELTSPVGEFSQNEVTLEDQETQTVELYVSSEQEREESFNVVTASTTSYAQSIKSVNFQAETCYSSEVVVNPESQRVASGATAEYDITVRNTGTRSDEFVLQTSQGQLQNTTLQIPADSSATTSLEFTPEELGEQQVQITAESEITTTATASATVYNGMESEISVPQQEVNTCENTETETPVNVENTGEATETFELQTTRGNLSQEEVTLRPRASEQLNLSYSTGDEASQVNYQITSTASTFGEPSDTVSGTFNVENCYDLQMNIIPEVASAGENRSQVYEVRLQNTGTQQNTYELSYEGPSWIDIKDRENDDNERTITVNPGETGYADIYAGIPYQKRGEVEITATAVGEQVKQSKTVKLVVGEDIEEAMKSDEQEAGGAITGAFTDTANSLINQIQGQNTVIRAALAIITGLILTAAILYWEW
ncbi:hypothetical protein AQV86_05610 [Nanohaloarchaea archaeon SG9]|nr:hypothetical protein AQV86_05610 [Nanohaloarchaea archaeon SG9]